MNLFVSLLPVLFQLFLGFMEWSRSNNSSELPITAPMMACDRRSDSLELVKFYNATGGPNWWKKWDLKKPIKNWYGIQLNSQGCVEWILLRDSTIDFNKYLYDNFGDGRGNNLAGTLIDFNLPFLKYISISGNLKITGSIPTFSKCLSLESLWLGHSRLTGTIPDFNHLDHLRTLALHEIYGISGNLPDFGKLDSIEFIQLANNNISGIIPKFTRSEKLKFLDFNGNELNGEIPTFEEFPNINTLDLQGNNFSGKIPLFSPNKIVSLDLSYNPLIGEIPDFKNQLNLKFLYITNTNISGLSSTFKMLNKELIDFKLHQNKITFKSFVAQIDSIRYFVKRNSNCIGIGCNDTLVYSPQQKIYSDTTITISPHTNYTLDLRIDDTVTTSTYAWFKDGAPYRTIKGSNKLPFSPFTSNDAGTYTVKITNPLAPQLTLESWPIRLVASPSLVCDRRSDSLELVKFYNATGGPNWTRKWDLTKSIDSLYGVLLSQNGCVIKIDLNENNLNGEMVSLNLPELKGLYLTHNHLGGKIPNFKKLTDLQYMWLESNQFSGPIPNFDSLLNLQELVLGFNQLSGALPNFNKTPRLYLLTAPSNMLNGIIPNFDNIPNLITLTLPFNQLNGAIPNFDKLPNLKFLNITKNQLTDTIPNFKKLPKLQELNLDNNQLSGAIPNFDELFNLQVLDLSNNKFISTPIFDNLPNLRRLDLSYNQISGTIPSFDKLSNLRILNLSHNQISGTIPDFNKLLNLQSLHLSNNQLIGPLSNHAISNPKLYLLDFILNKITFSSLIKYFNSINNQLKQNSIDYFFGYAPQQKIYSDTSIYISANSYYTLDLLIDDTVTTNTYTWYKNGMLDTIIKGKNELLFSPFTSSDAGTYTVKITNPSAPQLTLESWPIRLNASCNSSSLALVKPDQQKVKHQTPQLFDVLANDSISNGITINIMIDNPQYGSILYSQANGKGTYTPRQNFSGKEILNYTICAANCPGTCKSSTIEFNVEGPCGDRNSLVLPNIIFPTGSGANRFFIVEAITKCPNSWGLKPHKLQVFNRWGDLVYRNDKYLNDWDGTNTAGQPLPEGTYYYLLDLGSVAAPIKGYVAIVR